MQRPRILFTVGLVLFPIALAFFVLVGVTAYRMYRIDPLVQGVVISSETSTLPVGQGTLFRMKVSVAFDYQGQRRTGRLGLVTSDIRQRETWLREYSGGTQHTLRLDRVALSKPANAAAGYILYPENAGAYGQLQRIRRSMLITALAALGAIVLSAGMLYVGKRRAI